MRLFLAALLLGCSSNAAPVEPVDSAVLDAEDAIVTDTAAPLEWTSVEVTKTTDKAIIEKVRYKSGALTVFGQVCRPREPGKRKVLVWTHGGFGGLGAEWNGGL